MVTEGNKTSSYIIFQKADTELNKEKATTS